MINLINIQGLKKEDILVVLYSNAKFHKYSAIKAATNITSNDAKIDLDRAIKIDAERIYFNFYQGKVMNIDLTSDKYFNPLEYDKVNGQGTAEKAINSLK